MLVALTAFYLYTRPKIHMELTALLLLLALVLIFYFFPLGDGATRINDVEVLSGLTVGALIHEMRKAAV